MKAVHYERYGSPEVLELREIDKPSVSDDDAHRYVEKGHAKGKVTMIIA